MTCPTVYPSGKPFPDLRNDFGVDPCYFPDAGIVVGLWSEIEPWGGRPAILFADSEIHTGIRLMDLYTEETAIANVDTEHVYERLVQLSEERESYFITLAQSAKILEWVIDLKEQLENTVIVGAEAHVIPSIEGWELTWRKRS